MFERISRGVVSAFTGFVLLCLFSLAGPLFAHGISWPSQWKVFPFEGDVMGGARPDRPAAVEARGVSPFSGEELARIPERLEVAGRVVEGTWKEAADITEHDGRPIILESVFLDLERVFGEVAVGNSAFVFLPIESERAQSVTLGLSADWWMQAWLNGEKILDTTGTGDSFPIMIHNNPVEADLREGENVLAVRFISGRSSSHLAVGGPAQMAAWEEFSRRYAPELEDIFEITRDQAYWSARAGIELSPAGVDLSRGRIAGLEALPERQPVYMGVTQDRPVTRILERPFFAEPVRLLLSKSVYPAEDRHLDAVVWLSPAEVEAEPEGVLELVMRCEAGRVVAREEIDQLSPTGQFFSMGFPRRVIGRGAELEVRWLSGGRELGSTVGRFRVSAPAPVARRGRVPLRVGNDTGAELENAPFTVGVPFPRGALLDEANVRLVDENRREVPLQTRVSARWSRFGYVKWLLCDFTADLDGGPREFHLEYGRGVRRRRQPEIVVEHEGGGFPLVEAGRLRASADGLWYDLEGDGEYGQFLGPGALTGEFVEHEDGRRYAVAGDATHEIEEHGSEKVVVRRTGWYREEGGEGEFCNYVTRLVFHRDSPLVRVFHTWIFTGDGNRDRVSEMGWRFPLAPGLGNDGFLTSFGRDGYWEKAEHLLQWDHGSFDLSDGGRTRTVESGRSPGVAAASGGGAAVYFGAKDFWQNFPSELNFEDGAFTFFNWPRHNRPAWSPPASNFPPSNYRYSDAYRMRFAHEGELLDFRLPEEYLAGTIWQEAAGREGHWAENEPESANAQGIARTEEMFIYLAEGGAGRYRAARVLEGLNEENLRAVVDPAWVAASGAFGRIHHQDFEKYPEDEHAYREICRAPGRWADRLEIYGKWIFGDIAAWGMDLPGQASMTYRAFRRNHHGWPIRWVPFARSGDPEMFRLAERITRQMSDMAFCHYVGEEVAGRMESIEALRDNNYRRRQGWWLRNLLPWAGGSRGPNLRSYTVDCDYLWNGYYLTGSRRSRDVALLFGDLSKRETGDMVGVARGSQSYLFAYLDMYRATFDPWFLVAVHAIGDGYRETRDFHFDRWRPAGREFLEYTGCPEMAEIYRAHYDPPRFIRRDTQEQPGSLGQMNLAHHHQGVSGTTMVRTMPNVFGWRATGDEYYLGRLAHDLDWARVSVYEGEPEYFRGMYTSTNPTFTGPGLYTGWYIQQFPLALGAFEEAGKRPEPIPSYFNYRGLREISILKEQGRPVPLFLRVEGDHRQAFSIEGPGGAQFFSGSWDAGEIHEPEIPADAPPGVYTLRLEGRPSLSLPVAPPGVPEVFVLERQADGTRLQAGGKIQHWFRVPGGVESFTAEIPVDRHLRRVSIWNPGFERAWDTNFFVSEYGGPDPMRAVVQVKPGQDGKTWRITTPGMSGAGRVLLDPRIEPVFSVSREKWFDPGEMGKD